MAMSSPSHHNECGRYNSANVMRQVGRLEEASYQCALGPTESRKFPSIVENLKKKIAEFMEIGN
eukprot:SAG11_NODE_109_length_16381_cov_48.316546_8_plen_64_part_00